MVWFWKNFGKTLKTDIKNIENKIENKIKNEIKNKNKNKNKNSGKKQKGTIDSLKEKVNYLNLKKQVFDFLERFKNTTNQFMSDVFNCWGKRVPTRCLQGKQICKKLDKFKLENKVGSYMLDEYKRRELNNNCESDLTDEEVKYYSWLEAYISYKNLNYRLTVDRRKEEGQFDNRDLVKEKYDDKLWVKKEEDKKKLKSEISKWVRWETDRNGTLNLNSYFNAAVGEQYEKVKNVEIVLDGVSTSCKEIMDYVEKLDIYVRHRIMNIEKAQERVREFVGKIESLQEKLDTILNDYEHAELIISQQIENNVMNNTKSVIRKNGK